MNFTAKKVWITGASSGIGEHMAYAFAQLGCHLIISGRNVEALQRVASKCKEAKAIEIVPFDLGEHSVVQAKAKEVINKIGGIDILINNAGLSQRSLAKDTDFEVDKQLVSVDLLGTIALTKAILPSMLAQKSGHIVVVTSLLGKFGTPLRSGYAAAKHGLHGFFESLRAEVFQDNIKILMVCPGFIRTNVSINALTADGSKQGTMDEATANGLPPETVAKRVIRAIERNKEEIYVGGWEIRGIYMKRFFPALFSKIIRKAKVV